MVVVVARNLMQRRRVAPRRSFGERRHHHRRRHDAGEDERNQDITMPASHGPPGIFVVAGSGVKLAVSAQANAAPLGSRSARTSKADRTVVDALVFWLLLSAVGLAGLPFAELLLGRLPGRGLGFARPLALLLAGFPVWLLASLHLVPYTRWSAAAAFILLAAAALLLWRRGLGRPLAADRSSWLAGEAVFTAAFAGWTLLRTFAPDVWQTEKPMDMALVNVVNRSEWFPPHDPWLAGAHVNYYYFGHFLVGLLVRVTGVDPAAGFNLAVALFYALATSCVFAVAASLYGAAARSGAAPRRSPVLVGMTAAGLATVLGNLAGGVQFLHHVDRLGTYDWWSPSRVIAGTANEFPFFSFLLGDLHAHVMASPFALVAVAYAIQLAVSGPASQAAGRRRAAAELLLAGLVVGVLYAMNGFDFPTACAIGAGALLLWTLETPGRGLRALAWGSAWLAVAIVAFLPFWLRFSPPTHGLGVVSDHARFSRFAADYLRLYGLPLWVLLALAAARLRLPFRYAAWLGAVALFALVLLSPPRLSGLAVALTAAALAAFLTFSSGRHSQAYRMLWLLVAVGLVLVASGEVVYVRDAFDGTASYRFNTVFKTGYQAWFLFAVAAGVVVYWSASWLGRRIRMLWLTALGALVALALVYPLLGTYSRSARFSRSPTLDGMRWLRQAAPGDAAAILWLRRSVSGSPTLLEAPGGDFDVDGRGRVSTFTGLPAVIEWPGHEVQWGHNPRTRFRDAREIYATSDLHLARQLLDRYGVRLVFVGALERRDYPASALDKFARLGSPVFRSRGTVVYRLPLTRLTR
jgi:YYY domain-containing protein